MLEGVLRPAERIRVMHTWRQQVAAYRRAGALRLILISPAFVHPFVADAPAVLLRRVADPAVPASVVPNEPCCQMRCDVVPSTGMAAGWSLLLRAGSVKVIRVCSEALA